MSPSSIGSRGLILLGLIWLLALGAGCATMDNVSKELEKGYHALAQEEYYVKRQSKLWARPDRASAERGFALKGNRVVKLEGDVRGWSKVRVVSSGVEGWMPAACLRKSPVSKSSAAPKAAPAASQTTAPAKAPAAAASPPAEKKSGSILSPSSAEAAEKPPAKSEEAPKRKADPKKFEPL